MTNLEWLAKMPREEASETMRANCPFQENGSCTSKCPSYENGTFCHDADYMQNKFVDWLLAEREEHDAEQ